MKYQLQYYKADRSMISVEDDTFAMMLVKMSDNVDELISFADSLNDDFKSSLLEKLPDGSLTPYSKPEIEITQEQANESDPL